MSEQKGPSKPEWVRPDPRERQLAALAHVAIWIGFVGVAYAGTPVGTLILAGPLIPWLIWRFNRTKNDWLSMQALQATLFHMLATLALVWPQLTGMVIPQLFLVGVAMIAYASVGAVYTFIGLDFKYFIIGGLVARVHNIQARRPGRTRDPRPPK